MVSGNLPHFVLIPGIGAQRSVKWPGELDLDYFTRNLKDGICGGVPPCVALPRGATGERGL